MKKILLIFCILFSGIVIYLFAKDRSIGFAKIPDNKIFDERNYVLQGLGLRTNGVSIGYSDSGEYTKMPDSVNDTKLEGFSILVNGVQPNLNNLKAFPKPVISVNEFDFGYGTQHVKFVQPFLDHPPLGGLIYSLGVSKEAKSFLDIKPEDYRKPALYLAVITSILLFIFVYQVFKNPVIALLSTVAYNTTPSYLLITRFALLENLVAPLALLSLNLLMLGKHLKENNKKTYIVLALAGFVAGLNILAKEAAIGFLLGGIFLLIYYKIPKSKIFTYTLSSLIPILIYVFWGYWYFQGLFGKILIFNVSRGFLGSLNFINIFSSIGFKNFTFDGWWIWGFLSLVLIYYAARKKAAPILIPLLCELFIILFLSGINYPWYYFALIPLLSSAAGYVLWNLIVNPNILTLSMFFLFPLSSSFYWGYTVFHMPPQSSTYRILIIFFMLLGAIRIVFSKYKVVTRLWVIVFSFIIILLVGLNHRAILYILANWSNLPIPAFPVI